MGEKVGNLGQSLAPLNLRNLFEGFKIVTLDDERIAPLLQGNPVAVDPAKVASAGSFSEVMAFDSSNRLVAAGFLECSQVSRPLFHPRRVLSLDHIRIC